MMTAVWSDLACIRQKLKMTEMCSCVWLIDTCCVVTLSNTHMILSKSNMMQSGVVSEKFRLYSLRF